jgi:hypothetical protein
VDTLVQNSADARKTRRAALMGVFVSHFLSTSPTALVSGGIGGIQVQTTIFDKQSSISDPDFDLIQAFADALQVDVLDMLNRSLDRQATLDVYITSLDNIAQRANTRLGELMAADEVQTENLRQLNRERADLERELRSATNDRDYLLANEKQKALNEKEREISETSLKLDQVKNVSQTLEELLQLYGEKSLAIQENREPLIAGTKVVDLPGTLDLKILERRGNRSGGGSTGGGTTRTSGTTSGGSSGGSTSGGASTGGSTGGTSGGTSAGGSTGGASTGGSTGGNATGGASTGGSTGGNTSGGASTGGSTRSNTTGGASAGGSTGGSSRNGTASSSSSKQSRSIFGNPFGTFSSSSNTTGGVSGGGTAGGTTAGGSTGGGTTGGATTGGGTGTTGGGGGDTGAIDVNALLEGSDGSINELVSIVIALLLITGLFLCLIYLVWGGIKYITSAGNEESIKKANATIRYALLGLIVCLMGYFIVWWLAILLDAPFDLSFSHILDLMRQLYQHFNQPLE